MELRTAVEALTTTTQSILVTLRRDGRPQLSNVLHGVGPDGTFLISITADRAKYHNIRRNPWVALHADVGNFWSYVVVEGHAELSPVAADPHDDTVEALIAWYRSLSGEHPDWDDYRRAMVADRRVLVTVTPERAYGLLR